jgi:catechol 2,3-dioxygenase-like lactoylglutathione lyase family enzyme
MTEIIGIDHIYITVSDLQRSESFYDHVLVEALGFRKNKFTLGGDPHIQYFNRHFGYVLRPFVSLVSKLQKQSSTLSTLPIIGQPSLLTPMAFASKLQTTARSVEIAMTIGSQVKASTRPLSPEQSRRVSLTN